MTEQTATTTEKKTKEPEFIEVAMNGQVGYVLALSPAQAKTYAVKEQVKALKAAVKCRKLGGTEAVRLGLNFENVVDITKAEEGSAE